MAIIKEKFKTYFGQDVESVLKEIYLKEDAYERVLKISANTVDQRIVELAAALSSDDRLISKKITHDLKGMFGNLRLMPLFETAENIEQMLCDGTPSVKIRSSFKKLSEQMKFLKEIFDA